MDVVSDVTVLTMDSQDDDAEKKKEDTSSGDQDKQNLGEDHELLEEGDLEEEVEGEWFVGHTAEHTERHIVVLYTQSQDGITEEPEVGQTLKSGRLMKVLELLKHRVVESASMPRVSAIEEVFEVTCPSVTTFLGILKCPQGMFLIGKSKSMAFVNHILLFSSETYEKAW